MSQTPPKTLMTEGEVRKAAERRRKRLFLPHGMQAFPGAVSRYEKPRDRFTPIKHRPNRRLSPHDGS